MSNDEARMKKELNDYRLKPVGFAVYRELRTEVLRPRFNDFQFHHERPKVRKHEKAFEKYLFRVFVLSAFRGPFVFALLVQMFQMTKTDRHRH